MVTGRRSLRRRSCDPRPDSASAVSLERPTKGVRHVDHDRAGPARRPSVPDRAQ
jgi:hypothetical protein